MQHTMSHPALHIIYESYATQQVLWARQAYRIKILAQTFESLQNRNLKLYLRNVYVYLALT